jgi:AcrR family transcriptional regulator
LQKHKNDRSVIYLCAVKEMMMSKGEGTKQFIIEQAAALFNTKGIAATAMNDIKDVTKLSKGSLYVHFDNKEALAEAVVDYNMNILVSTVKNAVNRSAHPKDKLFAYLEVFSNPSAHPVKGGCPIINFGSEADDTNEDIRKKVAQVIEGAEERIMGIIRQGIKEGVFNPQWNYKEFATLMFASIEGGILLSRISGDDRKMRPIIRNIKRMIEEQVINQQKMESD